MSRRHPASPARSAFRAAWRLARMHRRDGALRRSAFRAAEASGAGSCRAYFLSAAALVAARLAQGG